MIIKTIKIFLKSVLILLVLYVLHGVFMNPRLDREWTDDQKILATVDFIDENTVAIKNIRNISYTATSDYSVGYYDKTINIDDIDSVWYMVEPFGSFGAAHTLVSFGFNDGSYLSISVEIRKEKGESFSPIKGIFRQYELVYVIADESDVIKLRTNYRKDEVRLYPINAEKEKIQEVFVSMLKRASELATKPEFYNTISSNCTTNIVKHVREFSERAIPWYSLKYLMPASSDVVAYDAGMIDTDLSLEEARLKFYITEKAQACTPQANFSLCIRDGD